MTPEQLLAQLLAAMGCADATEALTQVAAMNTQLNALVAATGCANPREAVGAAQTAVEFLASAQRSLGVQGVPAATARIEALNAAAARVAELEAQNKAAAEAASKRDAQAAMDAATADGRLAPALRPKADEMFAKFGIDGLKAFLDALPKGPVASAPRTQQPAPAPSGSAQPSGAPADIASVDPTVVARLRAKGFSDAEIATASALKHTSREDD